MKLLSIFKKEEKKVTKSNIQKMDTKQLSKVIGGGDGTTVTTVQGGKHTNAYEITNPDAK